MKTLVVSAIHGRKEMTQAWMDHLNLLGLESVIAYTDEEDLPKGYTWSVQAPNEPLSGKWQKAMYHAKNIGADRYLILGSDDFPSPKLLDSYNKNLDFQGYSDMFFWWLKDNNLYYFAYPEDRQRRWPKRSQSLGAGQMYSRKFLEAIDYGIFDQRKLPIKLQADGSYLDQIGEHYARELARPQRIKYMGKKTPLIMSPKIKNCMHPFENFFMFRTLKVSGKLVTDFYPLETVEAIMNLSDYQKAEPYKGIQLKK